MFGVYVHIPFCLQRCRYCDFATYSQDQIPANDTYVDTLILELQKRRPFVPYKTMNTLYFGGGTPSLLSAAQIKRIISALKNEFVFAEDIEITMEVNPATLDEKKLEELITSGVNRLSVGAQSFDNEFLKLCGRKHDVDDTLKTLTLIKKYLENFSLDLLFALPKQNISHVSSDVNTLLQLDPPHVSAYCLTVPEKHPMAKGRAPENDQVEMFELIKDRFSQHGLNRYEISNFAKPGLESQHNMIYWTDQAYWGLGLSAHSYFPQPQWGLRFWNPSDYTKYLQLIDKTDSLLTAHQFEKLEVHQSLTDYCHTFFRLQRGIEKNSLRQKFGSHALSLVHNKIQPLIFDQLVEDKGGAWSLSDRGVLLSNQVFSQVLISSEDIDIAKSHPNIEELTIN